MTKLRVCRDLHQRARECADAIQEPLSEFVRCCLVQWLKGNMKTVAVPDKLLSATSSGVVITIGETSLEPDLVRKAIAASVLWAEARRVEFRTDIDTRDWA